MTQDALIYALKHIHLPEGRGLWLNCAPAMPGDVYSPWVGAPPPKGSALHAAPDTLSPHYDYVVLCATKQMAESEGLLALALQRSKGPVIAIAAKDAGGNRLAAMMQAYGVEIGELSKSRCRIVWTQQAHKSKPEQISKNLAHLAPRLITLDGAEFWSQPGLFGWDKIDQGSKLLLQHLPEDLKGHAADFGCGYGYLTRNLAERAEISAVDAYDVDARAVALARRNGGEKVQGHWQDIRKLNPAARYDCVVMNPPFHSGKAEDVALGEAFIIKAWESLKPRGRLFFVANRHLPYEKTVKNLTILFEGEGFKILAGRK